MDTSKPIHEILGITAEQMVDYTNKQIKLMEEAIAGLKKILFWEYVTTILPLILILINFVFIPFSFHKGDLATTLRSFLIYLIILETVDFIVKMIRKLPYKTFTYNLFREFFVNLYGVIKSHLLIHQARENIADLRNNGYYKELVDSISKEKPDETV